MCSAFHKNFLGLSYKLVLRTLQTTQKGSGATQRRQTRRIKMKGMNQIASQSRAVLVFVCIMVLTEAAEMRVR